jgi:hypothetical protein
MHGKKKTEKSLYRSIKEYRMDRTSSMDGVNVGNLMQRTIFELQIRMEGSITDIPYVGVDWI